MRISKSKPVWICALIAGCAFYTCKKDATSTPSTTPTNTTPNGLPSSLNAFYAMYGAPVQTFTFNASTGISIHGIKGGHFTIPAGGLLNSSNYPVSGSVTVQLREIYSAEDMVLSNMPTMAGKRGLLSEGEYNIKITQGNNALHLNAGMNAKIPLQDDSIFGPDTVQGFANNGSTWVPDAYGMGVSFLPDSINITTDSLNWINADCYYPNSNFYQVTVNLLNTPDITQTNVYIYVNGHHAIWSASLVNSSFVTPPDIPQGAPLTIVGLAVGSNGTIYTAFQPYTNHGSNETVTLTLAASNVSAFQNQLATLH